MAALAMIHAHVLNRSGQAVYRPVDLLQGGLYSPHIKPPDARSGAPKAAASRWEYKEPNRAAIHRSDLPVQLAART